MSMRAPTRAYIFVQAPLVVLLAQMTLSLIRYVDRSRHREMIRIIRDAIAALAR